MKDQARKLSCKNDRLQQFLCLLVLLLDTCFLEKRCCTSWKRLRWDQLRSNTRKYTLHVLTCIAKSPSRSGTRTSAGDLIYLNSLTATAWLTVSNEQVRQKGVPFWCHRSKQASLLVPDLQRSLAPPACSKIEKILAKSAAWELRKYLWSRHLSDFSTGNTMHKIVHFSALILFLSWSTLHVYMLNTHVLLKTDPISWKCATLKFKPSWAKHVSLRASFSLILSPSSLLIAVVQILLSVLIACWMVVGKRQPE